MKRRSIYERMTLHSQGTIFMVTSMLLFFKKVVPSLTTFSFMTQIFIDNFDYAVLQDYT